MGRARCSVGGRRTNWSSGGRCCPTIWTVDWFHVVQLFTKAVDAVRRAETKHNKLPKALRWAVLKRADGHLTEAQAAALAELEASDLFTAIAWRIKEKLRWVRHAQSAQAARWRLTNFLRHAGELLDPAPLLDPVRKALATIEAHSTRILQRWASSHSNARLEGLNGLFQAARALCSCVGAGRHCRTSMSPDWRWRPEDRMMLLGPSVQGRSTRPPPASRERGQTGSY